MRLADNHDLDAVLDLQQKAYAGNRDILCCEPLPLQANYEEILENFEVWLLEPDGQLTGALILEPNADHMLVWSVATLPKFHKRGLGKLMMDTAEMRASQFGLTTMRLYTGSPLTHVIEWYERLGYTIERTEELSDRELTHMVKHLPL